MKKIAITFGLSVTFIATIAIMIWAINKDRVRENSINVDVVPKDAHIVIDGKDGKLGVNSLSKGKHEVLIWKDGFVSHIESVTLNNNVINVYAGLVPYTKESIEWSKKNQNDYDRIEALTSEQLTESGEQFAQKYPVTKHLPYKNLFMSIDYRLNPDSSVTVEVRADSSTDRAYAVRQIINWGLNPGDYDIDFINFKNPLGTR